MGIKQEIVNVCDDMIAFWNQFRVEIEAIPSEDEASIICRWQDYFHEHADTITDFSMAKRNIEEVKRSLIVNGKLRYVD